MVNFIAKFDIDEGTTQLSLQHTGYDPSADAEYDSWLLLALCRKKHSLTRLRYARVNRARRCNYALSSAHY